MVLSEKIDLLTSTNSFIKRLVANFVDVNKIRVYISILQNRHFERLESKITILLFKKRLHEEYGEEIVVYYCQKRCFVKIKNSDRNHCLSVVANS